MLEGPRAGQLLRKQCRLVAESLRQLVLVL